MKFISREFAWQWSRFANADFLFRQDVNFFTHSRDALAAIARQVKSKSGSLKVLLPDFICHTVVDALLPFEPEIRFYSVASDLSIDEGDLIAKLDNSGQVVLFVDYFGREHRISQNLRDLLRKRGAITIKDGAHSFLTMVSNQFMNTQGYDFTISSIYKNIQCFAGSICIGKLGAQKNHVDFLRFSAGILRLFAKKVLCRLGFTQLINRNIQNLTTVEVCCHSKPFSVNFFPFYRLLLAKTAFREIIAENHDVCSRLHACIKKRPELKCVFTEQEISGSVLQVYPVYCSSKLRRDTLFFELKSSGIDCYTWPVFPKLVQRATLWDTLLLLPLKSQVCEHMQRITNV